jgi:hypothetical protein
MSTVYFQFPSRHIYTIHFFWFQLLYFLVLKPRKDYPSHSVRFQVGGRLGKSPLLTSWTPPTLLTGPNVLDWSLPVLKLNLINTPTRAIHFSGLIRLCNPSAPNAGQPPAADNRRRGSGHRTNNRNSPTPIVELSTKFQPPKARTELPTLADSPCRPTTADRWIVPRGTFPPALSTLAQQESAAAGCPAFARINSLAPGPSPEPSISNFVPRQGQDSAKATAVSRAPTGAF